MHIHIYIYHYIYICLDTSVHCFMGGDTQEFVVYLEDYRNNKHGRIYGVIVIIDVFTDFLSVFHTF